MAFAALLLATLLFRLPALLNAAGVHSDAAIIGLQATHLLRGEWARFVWGAPYQGIVDVAAVAGSFALLGPTPLALMLAPLAGHVLLTFLAYRTLRRHLSAVAAAVACVPLVFTPQAVTSVALYAPRQWCLTFLFAALWLADGACAAGRAGSGRAAPGGDLERRRVPPPRPSSQAARLAAAALLCGLAVYCDLYALQLLPAAGLFLALCAFDEGLAKERVAPRALGLAVGAALALGAVAFLRRGADNGPAGSLSVENVARNWPLLRDVCLPWVLSARAFVPVDGLWPVPWSPPLAVRGLLGAGAASLLVAFCAAPLLALGALPTARLFWPLRRLSLFAAVAAGSTLAGFLLSGAPSDLWSTRYLAPLIWAAPFALALLARVLGTASFAAALTPYACAAALCGWLAYGPCVNGPLPVRDARGAAMDERALGEILRARGVHHAVAHYWLSYRLTFLWREDPLVAPLDGREDRYPPYRAAIGSAPRVAYLFHPSEPRLRAEVVEPLLRLQPGSVERFEVRGFTVLVHDRSGR